ncbi:MAG: lipoyl(octanoyl) transferase LipB [Chloroflexi bacterium]|nr:MAG: lipoyl(octanoyl) transferase LipB [Chloroflexota bacterium]
MDSGRCVFWWLGRVDYGRAWAFQRAWAAARAEGRLPDALLLLEHPHTYTFGRSGRREHLRLSEAECTRRGIALYDVDRGGNVTYHGPGQLVGYPILRLTDYGLDYHGYLRALEEVLIQALGVLGVPAHREPGYTGVWVRGVDGSPEKVAAIGVKVDARGITRHGFALNVDPDLSYFEGIVPCGIADRGVTSLARLLGRPLPMQEVVRAVVAAFRRTFQVQLLPREAFGEETPQPDGPGHGRRPG